MSKQKLERVLQLMINEENDKATDLLHDIFVEKARNIYSNMIKEDEDLEKTLSERGGFDFDISDMGNDLEDDLGTEMEDYDSEIDADEMYEADDEFEDDFDDAEMDLEDEMSGDDMDMDSGDEMDFDMDMDSDDEMGDMDSDMDMPGDAQEKFMNVDDALAELKAYFSDFAGDTEGEAKDDFDTDDYEYDDGAEDLEAEFGDEEEDDVDFEDEEDEDELKESASLKKVSEPKTKDSAETKETVFKKTIKRDIDSKKVPPFQQSDETGGTAPKAKPLGVDGPQENAGKLRKMKG